MRRITISGIRIRRKEARIKDVLVTWELTQSGQEKVDIKRFANLTMSLPRRGRDPKKADLP